MSYLVYAWIALFSFGGVTLFGKLTAKHAIANPWLFNFSWTFFTLLFTLPFALYNHVGMPTDWNTIIVASVLDALWFIFFTFATYKLDVSVLSPLYNFRAIFAVLLGGLLLGEKLNIVQMVLVIVIVMGGVFTSIDERFNLKSFFNKSIAIGISAMFFLALNNVYVNKVLQHNGFWEGTMWMLILTQLLLTLTFPLFKKDLLHMRTKQLVPAMGMGVLAVLGNICFNIAYAANVGITSLIAAIPISMILAFLLSIIAPKLLEKHSFKVYAIRFSAALVMILSALKLSSG